MSEFKREERYLVAKISDVDKHLSLDEESTLFGLMGKIDHGRIQSGKSPIDRVVIESDWKCYEKAWELVEQEWNA